MLSRIVRHAARVMLLKVSSGGKLGRQIALDSLPFRAETLIKGFLNGYFPMPGENGKVQSRNPEERCVIPIDDFHVPKNIKRLIRQDNLELYVNTRFKDVIDACAHT